MPSRIPLYLILLLQERPWTNIRLSGHTLIITDIKPGYRRVHEIHLHDLHQKTNLTVNNGNLESFSSVSLSLCLVRGLQSLKRKISFRGKSISKVS